MFTPSSCSAASIDKVVSALDLCGYKSCLDYANSHPEDAILILARDLGVLEELSTFLTMLLCEAAERGAAVPLARSLFMRCLLDNPIYGAAPARICIEGALSELAHHVPSYAEGCARIGVAYRHAGIPDWLPLTARDATLIKLFSEHWPDSPASHDSSSPPSLHPVLISFLAKGHR